MSIKPLYDRIVIENIKEESTNQRIFIPESVGDEPLIGKVVFIGNGDTSDGGKSEILVKKGDKVIYNRHGATKFNYQNHEYQIIRQTDIFAIINGEKNG